MRILSSFDTNFANEVLEREKQIYWPEKVLLVTHGRFFYYFMILIPTIFFVLAIIIYFVSYFYFWSYIPKDFRTLYYILGFVFFIIIFFPLWFKILKRYIDYILDFIVVTPKALIYYNQEWILKRRWRTVDTDKIKTITVDKSWLLWSMFNFWSMIVLSEWDEQWAWEINFKFVDAPDELKLKILKIIENQG